MKRLRSRRWCRSWRWIEWKRRRLDYEAAPPFGSAGGRPGPVRRAQNLTTMSPPKVSWDDLVPTSNGVV
ncbi:hypothetical protein, partial [Methylocapsa palsarum]|uniref:hypothetical protein n=1 Tax=Methylocapsa palsarum TaxID=1612308 RepID=UPI001AEC86FB